MREDAERAFFRAEVERLADRLFGTALRLTRDPADAEDLVAETVMKAWARFDQLADRKCLCKWLLRILANTFVSQRRRSRPESVDPGDIDGGAAPFSLYEKMHQPFLLWWSNPELALVNTMLREDIAAAIDAIPEELRSVLVLVEINGLRYAEAAETLGVPIGTVRSRLSRARSRLQRALWQHARDAGLHVPARKVADG